MTTPDAQAWAANFSAREAVIPTHAEVMSLVRDYAAARLIRNFTTPTKRQRENEAIVARHEEDCREVTRLEREISDALARAGLK